MRSLSIKKPFFTLLVFALLIGSAAGCSSPSSSSQENSSKLVVYLVGYGEQLSSTDVTKNNSYGYEGTLYSSDGIEPYLQGTDEFKNAQSLVFSYSGFFPSTDGKPETFSCDDTYKNTVLTDEYLLKKQIDAYLKVHPGTQVYLVGHSLGGVIAFAYMADVIETTGTAALDKAGSSLSGVSINDSPLGGVESDVFYRWVASWLAHWTCTPRPASTVVNDLQAIFNSASRIQNLGGEASIYNANMAGKLLSNQEVAEDAANKGIAIIIVGNINDLLWQPNICDANMPGFLSTQYLREQGKRGNGALYTRSFVQGSYACNPGDIKAQHFAALYNKDVQQAIWQTFTRQTVDKLTALTGGGLVTPTPTPPDFTPFVGPWSAHSRLLKIQSDGTAIYSGRTFLVCGNGVTQPCDNPPDGGMNTSIVFSSVSTDGKTIFGTVQSGTGIRDSNDNIIGVGSQLSGTLQTDAAGNATLLKLSDGYLLCSTNVSKSDPSYWNNCNSGA